MTKKQVKNWENLNEIKFVLKHYIKKATVPTNESSVLSLTPLKITTVLFEGNDKLNCNITINGIYTDKWQIFLEFFV